MLRNIVFADLLANPQPYRGVKFPFGKAGAYNIHLFVIFTPTLSIKSLNLSDIPKVDKTKICNLSEVLG